MIKIKKNKTESSNQHYQTNNFKIKIDDWIYKEINKYYRPKMILKTDQSSTRIKTFWENKIILKQNKTGCLKLIRIQ